MNGVPSSKVQTAWIGTQAAAMLVRYRAGEKKLWTSVRVPAPEDEDAMVQVHLYWARASCFLTSST